MVFLMGISPDSYFIYFHFSGKCIPSFEFIALRSIRSIYSLPYEDHEDNKKCLCSSTKGKQKCFLWEFLNCVCPCMITVSTWTSVSNQCLDRVCNQYSISSG